MVIALLSYSLLYWSELYSYDAENVDSTTLFLSFVWCALTIGLKSTLGFFTKPQNFKGTVSFGAGFFFVIIGWPIIGMILELYGFIVLFSGFWPTLAVFLQRIPILGWVLQHPIFRSLIDRYRGKRVPV
ncbi:vesicle transport protein GOT1 [Beta vulgaris subsp. vulgaris]|uniref:vesicle transport protein GOT1 n=1 Tax=Beta vulgaris subsp. vulgaris TaxID=3555 RepID=UPI0025469EC2|nr:vesicle transport protein GOT1 [Beta vulgaris subsp. vulgaris]